MGVYKFGLLLSHGRVAAAWLLRADSHQKRHVLLDHLVALQGLAAAVASQYF
jgi:hypothetical protein